MPGFVCPGHGRTGHSTPPRSRPASRRRGRCRKSRSGADWACSSVGRRIDGVRHDCTTVLSRTRVPTTAPTANATTSSPTMTQPGCWSHRPGPSGWPGSESASPAGPPRREPVRCEPATASRPRRSRAKKTSTATLRGDQQDHDADGGGAGEPGVELRGRIELEHDGQDDAHRDDPGDPQRRLMRRTVPIVRATQRLRAGRRAETARTHSATPRCGMTGCRRTGW